MTEKTLGSIKEVSHVILIGVSLFFTCSLFIQYTNNFFGKIVWGLFGAGLEVIKIYILLELKRLKVYSQSGLKRLATVSLYLAIAFTSGVATLGYSLNSLQTVRFQAQVAQEKKIEDSKDYTEDRYKKKIASLEREIEINLDQKSKIDYNIAERSKLFDAQIASLNDEIDTTTKELEQYRKEKKEAVEKESKEEELQVEEVNVSDTFTLIGNLPWIDRSGDEVLFFLMLIAVIVLEVALVLTAGELKIFNLLTSKADIESMVRTIYKSRTKKEEDIIKESDLPEDKAKQAIDFLLRLRYKKINIFSRTIKGIIKINDYNEGEFDLNSVIKIINSKFNIEV